RRGARRGQRPPGARARRSPRRPQAHRHAARPLTSGALLIPRSLFEWISTLRPPRGRSREPAPRDLAPCPGGDVEQRPHPLRRAPAAAPPPRHSVKKRDRMSLERDNLSANLTKCPNSPARAQNDTSHCTRTRERASVTRVLGSATVRRLSSTDTLFACPEKNQLATPESSVW